ncbi:MAG: hypothetical protein AAF456_09800 [Planctomycetota bacterium]
MSEVLLRTFHPDSWAISDCQPPVVIGPAVRVASRIARKVVMRKTAVLEHRRSWCNMEVIVLRGDCAIELDGETQELISHGSLRIPPEVEHRIVARSDVHLIVSFDACS